MPLHIKQYTLSFIIPKLHIKKTKTSEPLINTLPTRDAKWT